MKKLFLLCILALPFCTHAQSINTICGNGTAGSTVDGIPASMSEINSPFNVCADNAGNIYFTERLNHRVRMINTVGIITTICGSGVAGYNADHIPATMAQLSDPSGIVADAAGNIYIADRNNNRIRKIDVAGIITTIAGTGVSGYNGDGGAADTSQLSSPRGLALDAAGNLYIADQLNMRLRKVNTTTGIITTVAGNGTPAFSGDGGPATAAAFNGIYSSAVDGAGNIYISDVDNQRIRKVNAAGIVNTIAGTGTAGYNGDGIPATTAQLHEPIGVTVDATGNIYIVDAWNSRIRKIDPSGTISTFAGNGIAGYSGDNAPANLAQLNNPYGIALIGADMLIADNTNNRIRRTSPSGVGIANVANVIGISLTPNPAVGGQVTLALITDATEPASITITNLLGQSIYHTGTSTNQSTNIQLSAPSGLYVIAVVTAHGAWSSKLVVE